MIVSDTSALTHLTKAGLLRVLPSLFGSVVVPERVREEYVAEHPEALPVWLIVRRVSRVHPDTVHLDRGEAEAISLAYHSGEDLIIDERKGRRVARALGIRVVGTAAVLAQAYDAALIPSLRMAYADLRRSSFHLSDAVIEALMEGRA